MICNEESEDCTKHDVLNKRSFDVCIFRRLCGKLYCISFVSQKLKRAMNNTCSDSRRETGKNAINRSALYYYVRVTVVVLYSVIETHSFVA